MPSPNLSHQERLHASPLRGIDFGSDPTAAVPPCRPENLAV